MNDLGLYAERLPTRPLSLAELAQAALEAADWLNQCPDALWSAANDAAIEARNAFRDRHAALTGLSPTLTGTLAREGII